MASNPKQPQRSPWLYEAEPFQMTENLYYVGNKSVSVHMFDTGEGLLLLDTAYGETAYLLLESIRELGFDPHDIKWILHSHGHIDHFGATRMLVEKYHCKTYLPAVDAEFLTTKAQFNWCAELDLPYEPPYDYYFYPDVLVHPGDVLTFGNITVDCYSAAGHTPGTMAYVFHLPCGLNAAMHGGIGLNTQTSAYAKAHDLGTAWRDAYAESLKRLRGLKVDVVLGNHPAQTNTFGKFAQKTEGTNPFVDSAEWERFLDETQQKYEAKIAKDPM